MPRDCNEIMISMYVDELFYFIFLEGGFSREEVLELKTTAAQIFQGEGSSNTNSTPTVN